MQFFCKNSCAVVDVRDFWTCGNPTGKGKLKDIAKFLGMEIIEGMDGGQVFDLYLEERFDEISRYCSLDVDLTRTLAWRMGIGGVRPPVSSASPDPFVQTESQQ